MLLAAPGALAAPPTSAPASAPTSQLATPASQPTTLAASDGELPPLVLSFGGLDAKTRALIVSELSKSKRTRIVPLRALLPAMRARDREQRVFERAKALRLAGRKAMTALDHKSAAAKLAAARALLAGSFVRYYDARRIARIEVLAGVAAMQSVEPDQARDAFVRALHLDPTLTLTAHYSPQARAAFAAAKKSLPPAPAPTAEQMMRVADLAGAPGLLVVRGGAPDGTLLLTAMLLSRKAGRYVSNISRVVAGSGAEQQRAIGAFTARARARVDTLYPKPKVKVDIKPPELPPPPPPPRPWWKRWYTWVGVGVGVAAAIIVPLSLRRDTVTGAVIVP